MPRLSSLNCSVAVAVAVPVPAVQPHEAVVLAVAAARMRVQLFRPRCSLQRKASPWERVAQVVARKVLRAVMEIPAARVTQVRSARLCAPPAAAAALAEQPRV